MSAASPSLPPGGPSLAEVLIRRVFARPPGPFVDGELLEALEHADDHEGGTDPSEPGLVVPVDPRREPVKGTRIDVRV